MATEFIVSLKPSGGEYNSVGTWKTDLGTIDLTSAATKVFSHGGITGTITAGDTVTGQTSGATGTVVGVTPSSQILLQSITGTFSSGEVVQVTAGNSVTISNAGDSAICVLECYKGDYTAVGGGTNFILEQVTISGLTTDATNHLIIRTPLTERHNGTLRSGFYWKWSTNFQRSFQVNQAYTQVIGLDFYNASSRAYAISANATGVVFDSCVGETIANQILFSATSGGTFQNCFGLHNSATENTTGVFSSANYTTGNFYYCVAAHKGASTATGGFAPLTLGNTVTIINCVSYGADTFYSSTPATWGSGTGHNASSTYTTQAPPGTNNYTSNVVSGDFVDAANDDYHLSTGSNLLGIGTRITGVETDVDGDIRRSVVDIGFDQIERVTQILAMPTPENYQGLTDSRATSELAQVDHEGIIRFTPVGKLPFEKARIVKNLLSTVSGACSEDLNTTLAQGGGGTIDSATTWTSTAQYDGRVFNVTTVENESYTFSVKIRLVSGSVTDFRLNHNNSASGNTTAISLTGTLQRFSVTVSGRTGGGSVSFGFWSGDASPSYQIEITEFQVENVTGQTNQNPGEYVSVNVGDGTELITNGTFDTDSTGWSPSSCTFDTTGQTLKFTSTAGYGTAYSSAVTGIKSGEDFVVTFDRINGDVGCIVQSSSATGGGTVSANGTHSYIFTATADNPSIFFRNNSATVGLYNEVDNVSLQKATTGFAQYSTANGNTVASNVVDETGQPGAALSPVPYLRHVPAATNLVTYSTPNSTNWTQDYCTITSNQGVSYNGKYEAARITESATSGNTGAKLAVTNTNTDVYCVSCFAKPGTSGNRYLKFFGFGNGSTGVTFNIDVDGAAQINGSWTSAGSELVGNGWYYCWATLTPNNANDYVLVGTASTAAGASGNDGTSNILVDGVQVEQSSFATPPIPTSGASASRNATAIQTPLNTGAGGNFNNSEGALRIDTVLHYEADTAGDNGSIFETRNASANTVLYLSGGTGAARTTDGTSYPITTVIPNASGDIVKFGVRWSDTGDALQVGAYNETEATWDWSTETAFDADGFNVSGSNITLFRDIDHIVELHDIVLQDAVATTAEIEAGLPVANSPNTVALTADTLVITESTLTITAEQETVVTLSADSLIVSEGTLIIQQGSNVSVSLVADSLTISEGTLSIFAENETNITLVADSLVISEQTLTIVAESESAITLSADSLVISEGALSIQQGSNISVSLVADSLTISEGQLTIYDDVDVAVALVADALTISEGALSIYAGSNVSINIAPDSLTISEGTLTVVAETESVVTLIPDALTIYEQQLTISVESGITLVPDTLTISESDLTITVESETFISFTPDVISITPGQLAISRNDDVVVLPQADSLVIAGNTLLIGQGVFVVPAYPEIEQSYPVRKREKYSLRPTES